MPLTVHSICRAPASTAAAKQWLYTFFMGAFIVQLCARLALRPGPAAGAIALAIAVPTLFTVGATFLVHSARGTPRPVASTVPVALVSPPSFLGWAVRTRRMAADAERLAAEARPAQPA